MIVDQDPGDEDDGADELTRLIADAEVRGARAAQYLREVGLLPTRPPKEP